MEVGLFGWLFGLFWVFVFVLILVLAIGGTALWVWMLVDCVQVPDDRYYRSGSKLMWVLIIALAQVVGALIYLVVGRPTRQTREWLAAQRARAAAAPWAPPPQDLPGARAPDPSAPAATVPPPPGEPSPGSGDVR
ncbi:MAG: PLD nuclease N-terminal domain-containing protein [Actinomycetota bacterium]|nr:PLD nuclease N-terminal domain-containing protein [Actinomycetota bacterium]